MVQIKEFRIVMPMSLDEYQIAQMYMVMKMQQQSSTGSEGVEVLENRPFEDDVYGRGQYSSKVYHLQSKAPAWLRTFAPTDALVMQEEAWNAYPSCKTVIKCPYFTKFSLTIETIHKADNGHSENVHNLSKEQLAARQVEVLDIASTSTDYWSQAIGSSNVEFSKFKSTRTGRGPLLEGWQDRCNPVMTAYKLVTVDAPYWGFGYRIEQALLAGERALFLESHRNCFEWIDEWFGMTMQKLRELELQNDSTLNAVVSSLKMAPRWKGKGSKAKALADPMSKTVLELLSSLIRFEARALLSGYSVILGLEAEQSDLLNRACFGRPIVTADKDKQWFQLGMEEAFYLSHSLKCLKIVGEDDCVMNDEELWRYMKSKKGTFPVFYKAYWHLRMRNWVVRSGSQYGVDFVAYRHHPSLVHSEYAVLVLSEGDDDAKGRLRVWSDFHCTIRLCGSVAKTLLVLDVNKNGHGTVSPSCLESYDVGERTIMRWNPEHCREDQTIGENGIK